MDTSAAVMLRYEKSPLYARERLSVERRTKALRILVPHMNMQTHRHT
jgi:hypothetical protein